MGGVLGDAIDVTAISHALAALGFAALAAIFLLSWQRGRVAIWLVGACAATVVWAAAFAYFAAGVATEIAVVRALELVRTGAWLGFMVVTLSGFWEHWRSGVAERTALPAIAILCAVLAADDLFVLDDGLARAWLGADVGLLGRLVLAIVGLLLVENLFRNAARESLWAIKYLGFGLGSLFAYDFFLYADALLFRRVDEDLLAARGFINALIVPLIAVAAARNPSWTINVAVSRRAVFHSATLVAAGGYLVVMAGVGYYLRQVGGHWGGVLQILFLFAALVLLLVVASSGSVRAWLRVKISKHFFSYKYDYRHEWLRLIGTISAEGVTGGLPVRVIQAVADILDCPDGALWTRHDDRRFTLSAQWNMPLSGPVEEIDAATVAHLERTGWIVDLDEYRRSPSGQADLALPEALLEVSRGWLVVPLLHHARLSGLLLLGRPRTPKGLNWEDFDLLKTVGRQAASYLAEQQAAQALAESQQFAEFNRRFAFVIHDIKNLVSQLSLLVANAAKYRHNPAFQQDMLDTVAESVTKMNRLLVRLHQEGKEVPAGAAVAVVPLLGRVVGRSRRDGPSLRLEATDETLSVAVDEERFAAVLSHLVDNALDAVGSAGSVLVRARADGNEVFIDIEDNGPGMDPEFIRQKLFKPFASTKSGGYGIGAYESREFVREAGGRLDVSSRPREGTRVTIALPAARAVHGGEGSPRRVAV